MSERPTDALRDAIDALADAIHQADARELERSAADAGVDLGAEAEALRQRFLARVARARESSSSLHETVAADDAPRRIEIPESPRLRPVPAKIGRYSILRRLGVGGMGIVYAAYDEDLDRKIAIKVVAAQRRADDRRQDRLRREAQAMARVSHPNVVTVHEVGVTDDQLFIAMEFVAGPTLQGWLAERPRSWREVILVFEQAARGLQAIHDAGLVHRDFKPANVILGDDGRVRVLDLGLVGAERIDDAIGPAGLTSSTASKLRASLTLTGERVGTPAYMSREQFLGVELTPASDQYSLCIALFEALHGEHPFGIERLSELQANVIAGRVRAPSDPSRVPGWLHAIVLRGLRSDPSARFPSMQALCEALGRDRARAHRWLLGGALGVTLASVAAVAINLSHQAGGAVPVCEGAEDEIAATWSTEQHPKIRGSIAAVDRPYAPEVAERALEGLDTYAHAWALAHRSACLAHARGEHSPQILDQRMACLAARRQALAETASILGNADADVVDHADQLVSRLPSLDHCADLSALATERAAPDDPTLARVVGVLRGSLVRAEALANAGRIADAADLAATVAAEAETLGDAELQASALLSGARATINLDERRDAAEAMVRLLYARGLRPGNAAQALADVPLTEAMVERAGQDPALRALLLNNVGAIQMAQGDPAAAREAFAEALRLSERALGVDHLDLAYILGNLAIATRDDDARAAILARMQSILRRRLGGSHPQTLDSAMLAAHYTADPRVAAEILGPTCRALASTSHGAALLGECLVEQGQVADELDLPAEATYAYDRAREAFDAAGAAVPRSLEVFLDARLALARGQLDPAIAAIDAFFAEVDRAEGWWDLTAFARLRILAARILRAAARPEAAIPYLREALGELARVADTAPSIAHRRLDAAARWELAQALAARGSTGQEADRAGPRRDGDAPADASDPDAAEARRLAREAAITYRRSEEGYRLRLDAIDRFLGGAAAESDP
ncbi:MAG: serine/threonine-protein kinase [Nannocystaceae bacterium]